MNRKKFDKTSANLGLALLQASSKHKMAEQNA